jgi:hypothetical protein
MTDDENKQIQKDGANARAFGRSMFDNPYLKAEHLPAKTGETVEQWQVKHDLWELGWRAEDLMR